jgi:copper chaperone CopZ
VSEAHIVHVVDGRLRVRVRSIKNDPFLSDAIARRIRQVPGVQRATANPVTGSLTITYDPSTVTAQAVRSELAAILGIELTAILSIKTSTCSRAVPHTGRTLLDVVVTRAVEAALQRAVMALL